MDIHDFLKINGVKPSMQRIKIYDYLIKHKNHPTVDQVYHDLVKEMPTLSKTTIYNTFKLFLEKKIITMITIEENEARFDADVNLHGHFKCDNCGKIYDFEVDCIRLKENDLKDFEINHRHLYYKGICKKCDK